MPPDPPRGREQKLTLPLKVAPFQLVCRFDTLPFVFATCMAHYSNINYLVPVLGIRTPPPPPPTHTHKNPGYGPADYTKSKGTPSKLSTSHEYGTQDYTHAKG